MKRCRAKGLLLISAFMCSHKILNAKKEQPSLHTKRPLRRHVLLTYKVEQKTYADPSVLPYPFYATINTLTFYSPSLCQLPLPVCSHVSTVSIPSK